MMRLRGAPAALVLGLVTALGITCVAESQTADTVLVQKAPLAPVVTSAEALNIKLEAVGFNRRRANSGAPASQFLTRTEIERRAVIDLSQLLRRMRTRAWNCGGGVLYVDGVLLAAPIPEEPVDTARYVPSISRGKGLPPITPVPMPKPNPLDEIALNSVDAMEVYIGPSQIPLEYKAAFRQARCVVAIWTR